MEVYGGAYLPLTGGTLTGAIIPATTNSIALGDATHAFSNVFSRGLQSDGRLDLIAAANPLTIGVPSGAAGFFQVNGANVLQFSGTAVTTSVLLATVASATGSAGLNVPHGAAPSAPVNGDVWTTTAGLFVRINGATVGPLS
jgi:hypothetical protein